MTMQFHREYPAAFAALPGVIGFQVGPQIITAAVRAMHHRTPVRIGVCASATDSQSRWRLVFFA
ncbi:hypothetical protein [Corynebacterium sp. LK31]|uniref:hypothetical protein n=1 Tax=Corynebacterium sp. LK31 TaxID=2044576 RepID=UPI0016526955|nr:hypothetical protein [Corynebacterium sp. LK31]